MVERFIARRYLVSHRSLRFINVIAFISIAGITIGVAALLVALSVFNGFNSVVTSVLVGFDPHIRLEKPGGMMSGEYREVADILLKTPGVKAFSPFIAGKAMLTTRAFTKVVFIRGVDEQLIGQVSGLGDRIVLGSISLNADSGLPGIVIGMTLADRLGAIPGNDLAVYGPSGIQSAIMGFGIPAGQTFRIRGIYESNNKDYDANYAYISLRAAQDLFDMGQKFHGVELRLADFHDAENVKERLEAKISPDISISTWYDLHRSLYTVMKVERWSAYLLLCLIILVATFNMLGSLTMGVMEKRRDIAVLKSMGMTSQSLRRVFMAEGLLIGLVGTFFGILLGLGILYLQVKYQIFPLDTSVYIIPAIPVEVRWTDFVAIPAASLGLSFVAAYYPARRASSTLPAEALRWE